LRAKRTKILSGCWTSPVETVMSVYKEMYAEGEECARGEVLGVRVHANYSGK